MQKRDWNNIQGVERLPAVGLITCDPYFSIWSGSDRLYEADTMHWTGQKKRIIGIAKIDGFSWRFLGSGDEPEMEQIQLSVSAMCSLYRFQAGGVILEIDFWTPLLMDDLNILSRPCSYMDMTVESCDGKEHTVTIFWEFSDDLCRDGEEARKMGGGSYLYHNLQIAWMGQRKQTPLGHSGDNVTIDWGYLYLASNDEEGEKRISYNQDRCSLGAEFDFETEDGEKKTATLVAAYDDIASIFYFGKIMPGYWARNGETILSVTEAALKEHDGLKEQCLKFEERLEKDAGIFGEDYLNLCRAVYRQVIAAHKLIADEDQHPVFLSKECFSNGCIGTVDVTYPSTPMFFCYNPELVRGMLRPILKFARMSVWTFDFAPHDVGRYPYAAGQVYGLQPHQKAFADVGTGEEPGYVFPLFYLMPKNAAPYCLNNQMPVEECGNMLILAAQLARMEPETERQNLPEHMDLYRKWVRYLLAYGLDPGEQLCTDDFAGHLAHNVNLSIKAIMGVEAFAILLETIGEKEEAEVCHRKASEMAEEVYSRATCGNHTKLTFDGDTESWSLKYNAVWDRLFGSSLFPEQFYRDEIAYYGEKQNRFGTPLDSRNTYTKSDWLMWSAAMSENRDTISEFAARMRDFLRMSPDRVPFTDWYETDTAREKGMQSRSVQGGIFMPLLAERYRKGKAENS